MIFLDHAGYWWTDAVGFGVVFLIAAAGAIGLGVWVLRADHLNRLADSEQQAPPAEDHHS